MKRTLIGLLAAAALTTGLALAGPAPRTDISVSGTGRIVLPPDVASVDAAVETNAVTAGEAVSQNNAIYGRIVSAAEKLGITRSDITLRYYNVSYNPRPSSPPRTPDAERYGYTVARGFTIKVREIARAGGVADACTGAGATSIDGVSFGLSNPRAARAQAIQAAVGDARTDAEAVARAAGLRIVLIKSIELEGSGGTPRPLVRMAAAMPNPSTEFDQSNVTVSVSVNVTFVAQPI